MGKIKKEDRTFFKGLSAKESLELEKQVAEQWAQKMGVKPKLTPDGVAIWDNDFITKDGKLGSRKRTIDGKPNPYAAFPWSERPNPKEVLVVTPGSGKKRK